MTKKDFELIAKTIRELSGPINGLDWDRHTAGFVARYMSAALATTTSRFDRVRFLTACGVLDAPKKGV